MLRTAVLIISASIATRAPAVTVTAPSLLIIAPDGFIETMRSYAEARQSDLPTRLIALSDALMQGDRALVDASPSAAPLRPAFDDAERLKRFLFMEWRERHAQFVLLVGDADVMPVRYMCLDRIEPAAFDHAFYPSDLYYADVARADGSFDDWNAEHDGAQARYFGEVRGEKNKGDPINFDRIDYHPDLAIGRWPVSTLEQTAAVAAKTLRHIRANSARDAEDRHIGVRDEPEIAFIACGGWIENRPAMDGFASAMERAEWTIQKRYFVDGNQDASAHPPDAANVIALANDGCDVIMHSGHGSDDSWAGSISIPSIAEMHGFDGRLPIMVSAGCSTARLATLPPYEPYVDFTDTAHNGTNHGESFERPPPQPNCYQRGSCNTTGLGEQLLRAPEGGAVAYIGCNTGSQPCGMTLEEGFVLALANHSLPMRAYARPIPNAQPLRVGACWNAAVAHYWTAQRLAELTPVEGEWYPPSIFFQAMKFMLYGDPSLRIGE